jgi:hypothetical protein
MAKIAKPFEFTYPLRHKIIRDLKIVIEEVGELTISGTAYCNTSVPKNDPYERYGVDIDFIKWQGIDIQPVLEVTGALDEIVEAAIRHTSTLFNESIAA